MALVDLSAKFDEIKTLIENFQFSDVRLSENFREAFTKYISENNAGGYSGVEWSEFTARIITSDGKNIYLPNYWFYLASEMADLYGALIEQKDLFKEVFKGQKLSDIAKDLRNNDGVESKEVIKDFFDAKGYSREEFICFERYASDYSSWGGGKTIDRNDFYISSLMKVGNLLAETQSAVAEIAGLFYKSSMLREAFTPSFIYPVISENSKKPGVGRDLFFEKSRGMFVHSLVDYLIKSNREAPLLDCLVETNSEHGSYNLEHSTHKLTSFFKSSNVPLEEDVLSSGGKLRFFTDAFEFDSKYSYLSNQWTDGTDSRLDIQTLISIFNELYSDLKIITDGVGYTLKTIKLVGLTQLPKPFLLLAGISGTGKTRFVREQARASNPAGDNYCLVPVRPDWHEPSDLLGYISRLSGQAEYITTDVLTFIVKAWRAAAPAAGKEGLGEIDQTCISYWLCLDEMNLAPVEQYFADYLSVLESREFSESGYRCEALLNPDTLKRLIETDSKLPLNLGLDADEGLWQYFLHHGISLPPNLIVAGTVNMDETTHGFSRKVIDRAITLDFGEFFPNDYADFFEPTSKPVSFTWSPISHASQYALIDTVDKGGAKSIAFLESVNKVLKRTPFELAYRALNELLLQVACLQPASEADLQALWDDFLMTKVLPRIDGDEDKLRSVTGSGEGTLLDDLAATLEASLQLIWNDKRNDYFRLNADGSDGIEIDCRSKAKLDWMKDRLAVNTFTSYWP